MLSKSSIIDRLKGNVYYHHCKQVIIISLIDMETEEVYQKELTFGVSNIPYPVYPNILSQKTTAHLIEIFREEIASMWKTIYE